MEKLNEKSSEDDNMSELEKIGIAGPEYLQETLTNCSNPLTAIEEFQDQNSILLPSLRSALHFLDLHSITRLEFHNSVVEVLKEALLKQVTEIYENEPEKQRVKKFNEMLDKSFPVIKNKTLMPVSMHIMKYLPRIKDEYLQQIERDEELYSTAPLEVKRQIWQKNQSLFGDEVSPILNAYIAQKQALLFEHKSRKNFFSISPKVRRSEDLVKRLVEMIGHSLDLYDMVLQFLRTLFLRTRNVHYCTLRSDILMGLHETEVNDICSQDPSHKFTWCLDACIREHQVDSKRAKELQGFLDGIKRGQEEVLGDLAMVLADPYALHTCCVTLLRLLHSCATSEHIPRENSDFLLLLRMIQLGLSAWTMMDTTTFKEVKVSSSLVTRFLPDIEMLMVEEQIRTATAKLPDTIVETAEDISPSLVNTILENETAAYIMVYFACQSLNSKEAQQFASILMSLKDEGDIAYTDTLIHMIINDVINHLDTIIAAGNLNFIVDSFFMPKISREGMTQHLLRLFWNIQKKVPQKIMLELMSRLSVEEQDETLYPIYKTLQDTVESMEPTPSNQSTRELSDLPGVPLPPDIDIPI